MFSSNTSQVASSAANYIEDVFQTWLYTGNSTSGGTQTITNNIDLSTKGGLVWIKGRSAASNHILTDTARGAGASATNNNALASNLTDAEDLGGSSYDYLSSFSTTGFVVTQGGTTTATRGTNYNNVTYASWTFRKQAKFFDVVTYTGNGANNRGINHSLASVPGALIIKRTDSTSNWFFATSFTSTTYREGYLDTTDALPVQTFPYNLPQAPTSTQFFVDGYADFNANGGTYVAYLFAHNAGGFGLTGSDNVISCGSYTGTGAAGLNVSLGYEPQWVLIKNASVSGDDWLLEDVMRSMDNTGSRYLSPNGSYAEGNAGQATVVPTATGFTIAADSGWTGFNTNGNTYIYIAIRRGPMKTPTSGTSVFTPLARSGTGSATTVNASITTDLAIIKHRNAAYTPSFEDRLRGATKLLESSGTGAEVTNSNYISSFAVQTGYSLGTSSAVNSASGTYADWVFQRAPGFMDVVCWYGDPATVTHNLNAVPEWIIQKNRTTTQAWAVWRPGINYGFLNTTAAFTTYTSGSATSTTFTPLQTGSGTSNYVAYLFATCAGVSKVGSYTGTGTTLQIDCGFTGGARFVLIKRTDSTGDWYVWDSARGIVAGNDPYLLLNSAAAEVTNTDYIDTYSAGFEISSTAPAAINANGGSFIFLAIA